MALAPGFESKRQLYKAEARNSTLVSTTRQDQTSVREIPAKVSGDFITLPGGHRFRQATAREIFKTTLRGTSGQMTLGVSTGSLKGTQVALYHPSGGYRADLIFHGQTNTAWKVTGGFKSLNSSPVRRENERNQVITQALLKIADQKVNLGENLATYRQTVGLLTDPSGSLMRLTKEVLKVGKGKRFKRFLHLAKRDFKKSDLSNAAASEYLKYVYGWKPLMQDVYNLIQMTQESGKKPLLLVASESVKTSETSNQVSWYATSYDTKVTAGPLKVQTTVNAKLYARVDPNHATLLALSQLGLVNPASLVWELIPFSFVVDWLLPIGPVLQAMTARAGLIFVDGSISSRVNASGPYSLECDVLSDDSTVAVSQHTLSYGRISYEGYSRGTYRNWPLPGFYVDYNPFRSDRPLKAAALAIVALSGFGSSKRNRGLNALQRRQTNRG